MTITKYIILSIIHAISIPLSPTGHILLFKNIFYTNIFNHNYQFFILINSGIIFSITYILLKDTKKIKLTKKNIKISLNNLINITLLSIIPLALIYLLKNIIPNIYKYHLKIIPITFIINAIILLIIQKKNDKIKQPKKIHFIITGIINSLSILPGLSNILILLFVFKILKYDKTYTIKITLIHTLLTSLILTIYHIKHITIPLYPYIICIITITIISYYSLKEFISLYKNNKLKRLIFYLILISLLTMYYFR